MNTFERELEQLRQENERLKDQLQELEDTIFAIQNGEVDAMIVCDGTGKVIRASRTANALLAENCMGQLFDLCCDIRLGAHDADNHANTAGTDYFSIDTVLNGKRYESCDVTIENGETLIKHMLLSAVPLLGQAQEVVGCVINLSDISEKIKLEQDLRKSKEWFATTLKSIGDGVITTDAGGRIDMMNRVAEQLTGWKQEDALNQPLDKVFSIINEKTKNPATIP